MHRASKPSRAIFRALLRWQDLFAVLALSSTLLSPVLVLPLPAYAAVGVPRIINNQGRLMDANGSLLGGAGTDYCFKFSLFDDASVGSGSQVWPSVAPSIMTVPVKQGIYSVGVGDTDQGGDVLDYNFQDNDAVYLNVEVAAKVGATCAVGDGAETFENLSPRQRIFASGYAVNAATVGGFTPAQQATGNQIPVLSAGNLILAASNPFINATSTNALTLQGGGSVSGDIRFFNAGNKLTSAGNLTLTGSVTASGLSSFTNLLIGGLSTTTIQGTTSGTSTIQGFLNVLGTNSTSTFSGSIATPFLNLTGAGATSTAASGFDIAAGCFSIGGVCVGGVNSITANADNTLVVDPTGGNAIVGLNLSNANIWTGLQQFANASSSIFSAGKAFFGATATTTIDSAGNVDVAGTLDVSGNTTLAKATSTSFAITSVTNTLLKTDANGSVVPAVPGSDYLVSAVTSLGAAGQAQTGATQTFATSTTVTNGLTAAITITSSGNVHTFTPSVTGTLSALGGGTGIANPSAGGILIGSYVGGAYQQIATSSLGIRTTDVQEGSNLYYQDARVNSFIDASTTIPKTFSANVFSGLTTLNGGLTVGSLNGPLQANNGVVSATSSIGVAYGGTGVSTAPAYGQLLVGNAASGYSLVATSTLAIALTDTTGTLAVNRGGTGITSPTAGAIVLGDYSGTGYMQIATSSLGLLTTNVAEGSNLYYQNARVLTYLDSFDKGYFYSTTSADFWKSQNDFYSTTSADYWKSQSNFFSTSSVDFWKSQTNFYSTTSADYWKSQNSFFSTTSSDYFLSQNRGSAFSTTSATYFADASSTIAKTYSNNTFTGVNVFNGDTTLTNATTASLAVTGVTSSLLKTNADGSVVPAVAGVDYAAANASTFGKTFEIDASGYLAPTTSVTVRLPSGFVSQASSTVDGNLTVTGNLTAGNATVTHATSTSFFASVASSTNAFFTRFVTGNATATGAFAAANLAVTGSTTLQNVTAQNATTTNATSTSFFAGVLAATSGTIANIFGTNATITAATTTNLFATTASTTNLFASNLTFAGGQGTTSALAITGITNGLLGTNANGSISATSFSGPLSFFGNTLTITQANGATSGFLASSDWNVFNDKVSSTSLDTSAKLAALITDETGSGSLVFGTAPSITDGRFASTTLSGNVLITGNATGTNATTTTFYSTTASSTNLFTSNLSIGNLNGLLKSTNGLVATAIAGTDYISSVFKDWNVVNGVLVPTTTIGVIVSASSTFAGGITTSNATATNATTTSLFASIASSTSAFATKLFIGNGTSTGVFASNGLIVSGSTTLQDFAGANATMTNATSSSFFSSILYAFNGRIGDLIASTSATLASTTAYGRFITGTVVATSSTGTSTFSGAVGVGTTNPSYKVSIVGSTTAATSATGTAVLSVTNTNNTLSSGTNVLRLNIRTPFGTACTSGTTCPRFIEYVSGMANGSDTGGAGVGSLRLSTAGTGITQTSGAADFAEYMQLNSSADVGDLVSLNSSGQYQKAVAGQSLIGVISDNPAFVGNANLEGQPNAYVVGFAGVIQTTVSAENGSINAGDLIAATTTPGLGVKLTKSGYALGQALESYSGPGNGTIKVLVMPKYVDAAIVLDSYGGTTGGTSGYWSLATSTGEVSLASSTYSLLISGKLSAANASTTNISSTYASSTRAFVGALSVGNLNGVLKATGGLVSTALVNLTSEVTGTLPVLNGGTNISTPTAAGVLVGNYAGDGYMQVATSSLGLTTTNITEGTNLYYQNARVLSYLNTLDKGYFFASTSADYWKTQNNFFSTTSVDAWKLVNNFFSTTSTDYWKTQNNFFSTTSAMYFADASSTIAKTYSNNTFTGANVFNGDTTLGKATSSSFAVTGISSALVKANANGSFVPAIPGVDYAAANASTFGQTFEIGADGFLAPTSSIVVRLPNGFVSQASSTVDGNLTVTGSLAAGNATMTNATTTSLFASVASSTNAFFTRLITGNATSTGQFAAANLSVSGSTTLQNVSAVNATTTNATTTGSAYIANLSLGSALTASNGGTGISAPAAAGILLGNYAGGGYQQLATSSLGLSTTDITEGTNLYYQNARVLTYLDTFNKGYFYSTTSTDYWKTQNNFFSTTSADAWKLVSNFFSTTSSQYFLSQNQGAAFSTTSAMYFADASSTIAKTYSNNTFTGANVFNGNTTLGKATTTSFAITSVPAAILKTDANGSVIPAIAGVDYLTGSLYGKSFEIDASGYLAPTTSVTVRLPSGFVSQASSTVDGNLTVTGNVTAANATVTNATSTSLFASIASSTSAFATRLFVGNATATGVFAANGLIVSGSTTLQNFSGNNATTTNLYAVTASTTNLFVSNGTIVRSTTTNATTTTSFATTASSTNLFASNFSLGNLTGILKATAGTVSTALVNLATDVTGILQVANGGTGWAAVQAGSLLYGNGSGSLATTTQGSAGQMLAFLNGVPTWVATTTFSNGLTYANGNVTLSSQVALTNASSTAVSANDYLSVGRTATTTIRGETNATSTFAGGIQATALNLTGAATSSASGGFNLTAGCFAVNGTCLGNAQPGTNVVLTAVRNYTTTQQWTVPSNLVYAVVEVWGGGGGGGDGDGTGDGTGGGGAGGYASKTYTATTLVGTTSIQALVGAGGATTTSATGSTGGTSNFGGYATSTGGAGGVRANGGEGAGGAGGVGSGGDINLAGEPGGLGDTTMANQQGNGGSAPRGGNGGLGGNQTTGNGAVGGTCGGGGGGAGGAAGGGGTGCIVIYEYTATNVALGNGSVNSGSTGQVAYYNAAGQAVTGSSILYIDSVNGRVGVGSTTPAAALGVSGDAFINGRVTASHLTATGTLSVTGSTTLQNFTAGNSTTSNATSTNTFATTASSTNLFTSNFTLGGLTGILKATAGLVSASLVDLTTDITGILQVANGGTGWDNLVAGTLLTGNGSGKVATTTIGSSLQISGSSLGLNLSNPNIWTGLQTFTNASTTFVSVLTKASFGSTATTTIDSAGNVAVAGNLNVAGITLLGQATTTNLLVTASTTLQNFTGQNSTTTNATSTTLFANTASTTNLFASNGTITRSTTTNATTTSLFANTASTTDLYSSNSIITRATTTNATTTSLFATVASSTNLFASNFSLGNLSGILKATAGAVSTSLADLTTDITGILQVANGGTGWDNLVAGTLLTGNGSGKVATTTIGSSLQISGSSLGLNLSNPNIWTGLQTFTNASTTFVSVLTKASFGSTATTTIDSAGNVAVAGTLAVTGNTTLAAATTSNLLVTGSTTLQNFTARNATTTQATTTTLYISSALRGAGLSACANATDKLLWDTATAQFSCGTDAGAGTGIANLGAAGQLQNGASQTFATSTDTNIGLTITSLANVHTFTTIWNGILSVARGGTGWATIQAGTLLTGNGSGAVATTTIGSSLQISGSTLALNLTNANVWTGLQTFANASTTLFESVTQFAQTIQSTSTNALVIKSNLSSTAGLTLGGTTTPQILGIDTLNTRVKIGTGGATPVLFVLDTKNTAGDPTGVDGAQYYNSNTSDYRCFSGTTWRSCGGLAASSTGDVQFKNVDGSFTASSNFNWSMANNGLTITASSSSQTTDLFTIASSTGAPMFAVSSKGVLELATTTDPAAPAAGQLNIYAKNIAGRIMPKWIGPSGVDTPFQANLGFNRVSMMMPAGGTTATTFVGGLGSTFTNVVTTAANPTPTTASLLTSTRRATFSTGTTLNTITSHRQSTLQVTRGNSSNIGGFFYTIRFGTSVTPAGNRVFVGLSDSVAAPANLDPLVTGTGIGRVGMAINANTGNWSFVHNVSGTAPTVYNLGASFPVDNTSLYELILFSKPNDTVISYRVKNLATGAELASTTLSTNIPANTTYLAPQFWMVNVAAAIATFDFGGWYLESDQ